MYIRQHTSAYVRHLRRYGTFDPIYSLRLWGSSFQALCIARLDSLECTALLPLVAVENAQVHRTLG